MGKMTLEQILLQLAGGMCTSIQIFAVTLIFSLPWAFGGGGAHVEKSDH